MLNEQRAGVIKVENMVIFLIDDALEEGNPVEICLRYDGHILLPEDFAIKLKNN